jgi:dipeptidyl aminopeptidase/acylaminoacyl peptidase
VNWFHCPGDLSQQEHGKPSIRSSRRMVWPTSFYSVRRVIKQTDLETNTTRSVATLPVMTMYGAWRSQNDLVVYLGPTTFYEISTDTGSTRELAGADMRWAQFLPNSDRFVHVTFDSAIGHYRALLTDYETHQSTPLMETDSRVQYAPPRRPGELGHLLFVRGGTLLSQAFDSDHPRLVGEPSPLVQNVTHFGPGASACFSVSTNGVLVYQTGFPISELRWYDREGHVISTLGHSMPFSGTLRISPKGSDIAAGVWGPDGGSQDIWVFDQSGKESRRLTYTPAVHFRPIWSPDGKRIAFTSSLTGAPRLATLEMDDNNRERTLLNGSSADQIPKNQIQLPTDWSRDGRFISYDTSLGEEEREIWLDDLNTNKISPLLQNGSSQWGAVFSPDGEQIAFISDESGQPEVYIQSFESSPYPHLLGVRRQISTNGGWIARWRPDGRDLFYLDIDAWLQEVRVVRGAVIGEPKRLFQVPGHPRYGTANDFQFDVAGSGNRFVMTTAGGAPPPDFTVVENWQDKFLR